MKENENFIDAIQLKPIFDELQEFPIPQNSLNDGVHINKHDLVGSTRIVEALTESIKYLKNLIVAKDNKIEQISTEIDLYKNENLKKKEEVEKYKSKIMVEMQQSRFMEKKSSDIEIKLKNSIADKNEILEKLNFTTKKLCQTQKDHDFMIKCCQKIFQIFELPSDISLSEMIKIINTKEIEKKKLIDSCRNLSKKNFTLTENTNLLEFEMKEKDKQIFGLKSKLDDQQLATFVKEQQNIALQRQVDKANFADKVINELINHTEQISMKIYKMEAHVHQVRSRYKRAENEIVNLQSQNQDLQSQLNLSSSLNFDLFSRIQNLQIEKAFILETFQDHYKYFYLMGHQFNNSILVTQFSSEEQKYQNEINKLQGLLTISTKRYQSLISDLKKQIRVMSLQQENPLYTPHLRMEITSLNDDVASLKKELFDKNKLINELLQNHAENISTSDQSSYSVFDRLLSFININDNMTHQNQQLKESLEEYLVKNILLKENITTLGEEIEKLNRELKKYTNSV